MEWDFLHTIPTWHLKGFNQSIIDQIPILLGCVRILLTKRIDYSGPPFFLFLFFIFIISV